MGMAPTRMSSTWAGNTPTAGTETAGTPQAALSVFMGSFHKVFPAWWLQDSQTS